MVGVPMSLESEGIRMRMPSARTMTTSVPSYQTRRFEPHCQSSLLKLKLKPDLGEYLWKE